jgi:DNA-binding NtrC family response regulator
MARILIVQDDRMTALALERAMTRMGHTVVARTTSAAEALAAVQADCPDGVLLDLHLPGQPNSLKVGMDIQAVWFTPVIILSSADPAQLGMPDGPDALWCSVAKPIHWHQLQDILARLFSTHPLPPCAPGSGLEDTPPVIRWPIQALRALLRHLRQPMGAC